MTDAEREVRFAALEIMVSSLVGQHSPRSTLDALVKAAQIAQIPAPVEGVTLHPSVTRPKAVSHAMLTGVLARLAEMAIARQVDMGVNC